MEWIQKEYKFFKTAASNSVEEVRRGIKRATWHHILLVITGIIFLLGGASGQILCLNFWLASFPQTASDGFSVGGPYTVLLSSSTSSLILYIIVAIFWQLKYRPPFHWYKNGTLWLCCGAAGLCLCFNGLLVVYATPHTPEVLQALLLSSQLLFTLFFAVIFKANMGKNYCHVLVIFTIILSVVGVVCGVFATSSSSPPEGSSVWWVIIFAAGIMSGALVNVVAAKLMMSCAYDEEDVEQEEKYQQEHHSFRVSERSATSASASAAAASGSGNNITDGANNNAVLSGGVGKKQKKFHRTFSSVSAFAEYGDIVSSPPNSTTLSNDSASRQQQQNNNTNNTNNISPNHNKNNKNEKKTLVGNNSPNNNNNSEHESPLMQNETTTATTSIYDNPEENGSEIMLSSPVAEPPKQYFGCLTNYPKIETGWAKILLLLIGTTVQVLMTLVAMPLDFAPFFGFNQNSTATTQCLSNGFACSFNSLEGYEEDCKNSARYFLAFAIFFAATNAGVVIISSFSAPLTSVVSQIAAPMTALLILIDPKLSPTPQSIDAGLVVVSVITCCCSGFFFGWWEEMTSSRMYEEMHPDDDEEEEDVGENNNEKNGGDDNNNDNNNNDNVAQRNNSTMSESNKNNSSSSGAVAIQQPTTPDIVPAVATAHVNDESSISLSAKQ